jgi:hypothetical protein
MWAMVAALVSAGIAVPIVVVAGRNSRVAGRNMLWNLADAAGRQVIIVGGLAGFAVTGIVLLVSLARDRADIASDSFNATVFMFLTAYLFFVASAFLFSFLPRIDPDGEQPARIQFVMAGNLEYRSVLLAWFALRPLMQTFGLDTLADLTAGAITASMLLGSLFGMAIFHGIGVITFREVLLLPLLSAAAMISVAMLSNSVLPELKSTQSTLYLTGALYGLNALTFGNYALGLLSSMVEGIGRRIGRYFRLVCVADLQATMILVAFLWMAVMGIL